MAKANKKQVQEAQKAEVADVPAEETKPLEPVQLTVGDLQLLGRIIDLSSRRGAFQAPELKQVGEAYDKLAAFLAYVDSVQAKEAEENAVEKVEAEPVEQAAE